jgi:hypothetical protein
MVIGLNCYLLTLIVCVIICDDVYKDMAVNCDLFDFSDYPSDHPLFSVTNKKVMGKMKDETNGSPISEFCGLRAKMYSILCDGVAKKRAKGVSKGVVKNV